MLKKIKHYFLEEIWNFSINETKGLRYFYYKVLRIGLLSIRGFFFDHSCGMSASSLTYFTLMTLVPFLTLITLITQKLGLQAEFREQLFSSFPNQREILFKFADAYLAQIQKGLIVIGFAILILSLILMLRNVEIILNQIWNVEKQRSWTRGFVNYLLWLLIFPVLFILANSAAIYIVGFLWKGGGLFFINLIPYAMFWGLFVFLYAFIPNTKVSFRSAAVGSLFAASLYLIAQWGYFFFQREVIQYGAIYGTMAALVLFLIWLQLSWYVILFGAEVAHAHQAFTDYEFELRLQNISFKFRKLLWLWVTRLALKKKILTLEFLTCELRMPKSLSKMILQDLVRCHILQEVKEGVKIASDIGKITLLEVLKRIESQGDTDFGLLHIQSLNRLKNTLEILEKSIESLPENQRIEDVPDPI